jgi:hypothetical protein
MGLNMINKKSLLALCTYTLISSSNLYTKEEAIVDYKTPITNAQTESIKFKLPLFYGLNPNTNRNLYGSNINNVGRSTEEHKNSIGDFLKKHEKSIYTGLGVAALFCLKNKCWKTKTVKPPINESEILTETGSGPDFVPTGTHRF